MWNPTRRHRIPVLAWVVLLAVPAAAARAQPQYEFIPLAPLPADIPFSTAADVDNGGTVVGQSRWTLPNDATVNVGVVWFPGGYDSAIVLTRPPSATPSFARGIGRGAIVGQIGSQPVRWVAGGSPGGVAQELSLGQPPSTGLMPRGINDHNQAVGTRAMVGSTAGQEQAVYWDADRELHPLSFLSGRPFGSVASDINNQGVIVGSNRLQDVDDSVTAAVVWRPQDRQTSPIELPLPPGTNPDAHASAINDAGDIVGFASRPTQPAQVAVRWRATPSGYEPTILNSPIVAAAYLAGARDINERGEVVGVVFLDPSGIPVPRAVYWDAAGNPIDLNTLIPAGSGWTVLSTADAINDQGWIVGSGTYDPDGVGGIGPRPQGFLLRPVPEPAGALLALLAGVAIGGRRNRRRT